MVYSIRELSELAGVSARTLRYYDAIGLLKPLYVNEAGYRFYGESEVDASNQKMLNMSEEEWKHFKGLEEEIKNALKKGVKEGISADSAEAAYIVKLHKEWLCMTLKQYSPEIHKGIASMYTADERFKAYYDAEVPGCAALLVSAVNQWCDRL